MLDHFGRTAAAVMVVLGIAVATPAPAQITSPTGDRGPLNENFGGGYKDPQQRAADHLAKGLRYKKKADEEADTKKKAKLLDKAKKEFQSSLGLHPNHDAYLTMGLLHLDLGDPLAAADACNQALALQPGSEGAKACVASAKEQQAGKG
jgi:tetratricopeptide (TPR) repeat protein